MNSKVSTLFLIFTLFCSNLSVAQGIPELTSPVVDLAGLLDENQSNSLREALQNIHQNKGPQISILTVPSLNDIPIEDYTMSVAQKWRLGTENKDNGIILVVALEDRKVRIEVGQGLEGDLTDAYSKRIIDYDILPYFRNGQFAQGLISGVRGILLRMDPPIYLEDYLGKEHLTSKIENSNPNKTILNLFYLFIILFFFIIPLLPGNSRSRRGYGGPIFIPGHRNSGSSRSRGGWSGGGGGFSGGGASGSW